MSVLEPGWIVRPGTLARGVVLADLCPGLADAARAAGRAGSEVVTVALTRSGPWVHARLVPGLIDVLAAPPAPPRSFSEESPSW